MNTTDKIKSGFGAAAGTAIAVAAISALGYGIYKWFNS